MRILLATDHFPPFIGGAHRQAQLIAEAMAERGHEVVVATPWHGGLPGSSSDDGVSVHRVRQLRTAIPALVRDQGQRHQPPFPDPVTILGLRRLIADFEPELIHAYGWLAFSVAAALGRQADPDAGLGSRLRLLLRDANAAAQGSSPAPARRRSSASTAPATTTARPKGWSPPPAWRCRSRCWSAR